MLQSGQKILEGKIYQWANTLHNILLFDKNLKLSWLKLFLCSQSKWTIFPKDFELKYSVVHELDFMKKINLERFNYKSQYIWVSKAALYEDILNISLL